MGKEFPMLDLGLSYLGLFPKEVITLVKCEVKKFKKIYLCLERVDFEDLMQECVIHLWNKTKGDLKKYEYIKAFARKVVVNFLKDFSRKLETDRRKINNKAISLDREKILNNGEVSLYEVVSSEDILYPVKNKGDIEESILKLELIRVLHLLDQKELLICVNILKGYQLSEISKIINIPRSSLYDQLKKSRIVFLDNGMQDYL